VGDRGDFAEIADGGRQTSRALSRALSIEVEPDGNAVSGHTGMLDE
jgi:hypothetical protein